MKIRRLIQHWSPLTVCCIAIAGPNGFTVAADSEPANRVTTHPAPKPLAKGAVTGDWPTLLGPTLDNCSPETKLLRTWPAGGPTPVWEMETGEGFATPAIDAGRLVYFHRVGDEERVERLHPETGQSLWAFGYPTAYRDRYGFNNGPRCGPVIDRDRVYTHGAEGKLHCLDIETGSVVWQRDTSAEYNVPQNYFGVGSTPLVHENLLIVTVGAPGGPCVVAFDKMDGRVIWRAGDEWTAGYATPISAVVHGRPRILVFTGGDSRPPIGGLMSIDPANGKVDFRFPLRGKRYESLNASSPVCVDNSVFISSSYRTGGVKLSLRADGSYEEVWRTDDLGAHFATPIHRAGFLYGITGGGKNDSAVVCLDFATGKARWSEVPKLKETIERGGKKEEVTLSTYQASVVYADDLFLILGELGHLLLADMTPERFGLLQQARLFHAAETFTPPVLSRGLLYVCQNRPDTVTRKPPRLICYDLRGTE